MSRSEFFARAAERWADELERDDLTAAINAAIEFIGDGKDENEEFLREAARRTFARADDE